MTTISHRYAGACSAVMLLLLGACSANNMTTTVQHSSVDQKTVTLDCRKANELRFVVVRNLNRKKDSDATTPEDLSVEVGDQFKSKIELPKESVAKNFSLHSVEKTETGFDVRVGWGGGLYYYKIQFSFRCKENNFFLYEVTKESFSTTNPDSGNFLDKKETKVTKIDPNLPLEKFVMTDYL